MQGSRFKVWGYGCTGAGGARVIGMGCSGCWIQSFVFPVQGLECYVGSEFCVYDSGFRALYLQFRVRSFVFTIQCLEFYVYNSGFRVLYLRFRVQSCVFTI